MPGRGEEGAKHDSVAVKRAFARALITIREERSITQEKLGEDSGYHEKYISMLERAVNSPSLTAIVSIAAGLEMRPSELISRVEGFLPKAPRAPGHLERR